jgi:hypothetical protein
MTASTAPEDVDRERQRKEQGDSPYWVYKPPGPEVFSDYVNRENYLKINKQMTESQLNVLFGRPNRRFHEPGGSVKLLWYGHSAKEIWVHLRMAGGSLTIDDMGCSNLN